MAVHWVDVPLQQLQGLAFQQPIYIVGDFKAIGKKIPIKIQFSFPMWNIYYRVVKGGGVPRGGGSLIFPKVPQSSLGIQKHQTSLKPPAFFDQKILEKESFRNLLKVIPLTSTTRCGIWSRVQWRWVSLAKDPQDAGVISRGHFCRESGVSRWIVITHWGWSPWHIWRNI